MVEKTKFAFRIVLVEFRESDLIAFPLSDKTEACEGKIDLIQTKKRMNKNVDFIIENKIGV